MERLGPILRISAGLALLTCSILLGLDMAGLVPAPRDLALESHIQLCERLGAQASVPAEQGDLRAIRSLLELAVRREPDLLSAGMRSPRGRLLVSSGDHGLHWSPETEEGSTRTHVRIPLFQSGELWSTLEVRFADPAGTGLLASIWQRPVVPLLAFVGVLGFVVYGIYMRRTLRHLDPSAVIPTRVQAALDVMSEGVLLIDDRERVVLANRSLAEHLGHSPAALMGLDPGDLGFVPAKPEVSSDATPWRRVLRDAEAEVDATLRLEAEAGEVKTFEVTAAPILDGWGRSKGAIVTFDDATELVRKTQELEEAMVLLEKSQEEIQLQNEELQVLALSDPLTGVANRRAFMEKVVPQFEQARRESAELSCIMADIDHFKAVNDTHGHTVGDEVICRLAALMQAEVGPDDTVCRYGGEEFCIFLPGSPPAAAQRMAERMRRSADSPGFARVPVTVSFGVSSLRLGAEEVDELIDQADNALYASKAAGRNRVSCFEASCEVPRKG